jgi:hypothetical protein
METSHGFQYIASIDFFSNCKYRLQHYLHMHSIGCMLLLVQPITISSIPFTHAGLRRNLPNKFFVSGNFASCLNS